jgi:hypothetical protein
MRLHVHRNAYGNLAYVQDTSGWVAVCSRTVKHDIKPFNDNTEILHVLRTTPVYSYYRNDIPDKKEIGLISETTPDVLGSDGFGMATSKTVGFLMAVFKAQQQKLHQLEQELRQLKNEK